MSKAFELLEKLDQMDEGKWASKDTKAGHKVVVNKKGHEAHGKVGTVKSKGGMGGDSNFIATVEVDGKEHKLTRQNLQDHKE